MIPLVLRRLPAAWRLHPSHRLLATRNWLSAYLRFASAVRLGDHAGLARSERLTVILLSYRRPANIEPICRAALACPFVDRVVVSNADRSIRMANWIRLEDPRLALIDGADDVLPARRFALARNEPGTYFASIDDDLFLTPSQIALLFGHLIEQPHVLHGIRGQLGLGHGATASLGPGGRIHVGEVDVLNTVYFFTADHAREYGELRDRLEHQGPGDDIVASFCGTGRPLCHGVGFYPLCPTSGEPGVAVCTRPGFHEHRTGLYQQLLEIKPERAQPEQSGPQGRFARRHR